MNKKIKENFNNIIKYFILMQPIIDLITSICLNWLNINITIGIIIRTLFLIFSIYSVLFVFKEKKMFWYYLIIFIYFIIFSILTIKFSGNIFEQMQFTIRSFYFPILLTSFYGIKDKINISKGILRNTFIIYITIITICTFFSIGFNSYDITKTGTLGLFNSANEIGGIISILTPFLIKERLDKTIFFEIILYMCYFSVILNMGTKTPIIAFALTIILILIWAVKMLVKKKQIKKIFLIIFMSLTTITLLISIIPKTAFYKNIKIHLKFLEVNDVIDVFEKPMLIDHFIFSQRLTFLDNREIMFNESDFLQKNFGIGYFKNGVEIKLVEMDYFDIYYSHGIIGFIIYYFPIILILWKIMRNKYKITFETYQMYISIFLILILSFFTGHIMTAPSVSFFAVCIVLAIQNKNEKYDQI